MQTKTPEQAAKALEKELSIRPGFLQALYKEDDWSFVIKGHAFIEAATTHLLVSLTGDKKLRHVFSKLELSNVTTGKLAFLKAMGKLNEKERRFIRKFSELRNMLVHDISQIDFELTAYISSMDKNQQRSFAKAFSYFSVGDEFEINGQKISVEEYVIRAPKTAIWFSLILFSGIVYLLHDTASLKRKNEALERTLAARLLTAS